ncbi:MAG: ATP synthase F1 subunit delta [Selenomonadaceae bacterium]|nr:ATP synthase F1 subunit delta [Selenomonadaceae bacterium]
MLNLQLARKYAGAIFAIAQEEDKLTAYGEELDQVKNDLFSVEGAKSFFQNPQIQPQAKKELLTKLFEGELSPHIYHFLLLLVDKRRIGILADIAAEYHALANKAMGIIIADVTTVSPMESGQEQKLKAKLEEVTGKTVELRHHQDESIIGGVVVKIGDRRLDGSVAGRLAGLARELKG